MLSAAPGSLFSPSCHENGGRIEFCCHGKANLMISFIFCLSTTELSEKNELLETASAQGLELGAKKKRKKNMECSDL